MELQAVMATLGQRTLAESRLKANQPDQKPDGTTVSPAPKAGGYRPCYPGQQPTSAH